MAVGASSTVEPLPSSDLSMSTRARRTESIGESGDVGKYTSSSLVSSPPPLSETSQTRSTRSTSTTSRNSNRLSLTLPIAPPNSFPSRPTPTASMPPTPIESSALSSPTEPNDFIIAIAAQERRVLELREELGRAEHELRRLKKQYTASDAYKKRGTNRNIDPLRARALAPDVQWGQDDGTAVRYTSELERRKAILLAQSQATPREHKRTVIRGGHTRALSLLSPTKSANGDGDDGGLRSADPYTKPSPVLSPAPLNKRATWAPRQSLPANGMKQMANELKQGLWTFVEDLRQATVGDEGISGTTSRTSEMSSQFGRTDSDQNTIRASTTTRGRMPFQDEPESAMEMETPSRSSTGSFSDRFQHRRTASRPEPSKAKKHYSWTPLTFDNYDDEDWSNWDTPNVKTARWSGSTVNGDIISAIPERNNENEGTLRRKPSRSELRSPSPQTPSKLEDLPAIFNRLTPSNVKNMTSNFIKEWEKSLSSPTESESLI
ncbi:C-8 sterol isomerase [Hypoxylon texense]